MVININNVPYNFSMSVGCLVWARKEYNLSLDELNGGNQVLASSVLLMLTSCQYYAILNKLEKPDEFKFYQDIEMEMQNNPYLITEFADKLALCISKIKSP